MTSDGPKVLRTLPDGWSLRQWDYDHAPLQLHRRGKWTEITIDAEPTVGLEVEWEEFGTIQARYDVPTIALRALLPDLAEVDRLRADLEIALGALADIGSMSTGETRSGVGRNKAARIYNDLRCPAAAGSSCIGDHPAKPGARCSRCHRIRG